MVSPPIIRLNWKMMCQTFPLFEDCPFRSSGQGHVGHTLRHPHLLQHSLVRTLCWHGRQHEAQIHKGLAVDELESSGSVLWHTVGDIYNIYKPQLGHHIHQYTPDMAYWGPNDPSHHLMEDHSPCHQSLPYSLGGSWHQL